MHYWEPMPDFRQTDTHRIVTPCVGGSGKPVGDGRTPQIVKLALLDAGNLKDSLKLTSEVVVGA